MLHCLWQEVDMWKLPNYAQNYLRHTLKLNINFLNVSLIFPNIASQNPTIIFQTYCMCVYTYVYKTCIMDAGNIYSRHLYLSHSLVCYQK
jgi:hypothetical protein